jgi:hypothetical protein
MNVAYVQIIVKSNYKASGEKMKNAVVLCDERHNGAHHPPRSEVERGRVARVSPRPLQAIFQSL